MNPESMSHPKPPRGEDLPYDDGEPMESERHKKQMDLLQHSLLREWRDRDDVYVAANMALYFSETQAKRQDFRAPDLFIVLDTHNHVRRSWVAWEEDGRLPDVIVELVSDTTEKVDRGVKKDIYARLVRVPSYVIYDPFTTQLEVYTLDLATRRYVAEVPDARGLYRIPGVGLALGVREGSYLGVQGPWLRWFRDDGSVLETPEEASLVAEERASRAEAQQRELLASRR